MNDELRRQALPGQLVYDVDQISDAVFIIEMGTVDIVVKGKQALVATMGSGQSFGELAFFHPDKRVASAAARERTQLVQIPFDKLGQLLSDRPTFGLIFYRNGLYVSCQACSRAGPGAQSPLLLVHARLLPRSVASP